MKLPWTKDKNPVPVTPVETPAVERASVHAAANDSVLKRFFISEKSTRGLSHNQYTFQVARHATKSQIRDAVQRSYKVKVIAVNTISLPSKERRLGKYVGSRPGPKKAVVTLKAGDTIAQAQP